MIFNGIDFEIYPGETLGIVGIVAYWIFFLL